MVRPAQGVVGGDAIVDLPIFRNDTLYLHLPRLTVYPTGFSFRVDLYLRSRHPLEGQRVSGSFPWALLPGEPGPGAPREPASAEDVFRVGVLYGDGRRTATGLDRPPLPSAPPAGDDPPLLIPIHGTSAVTDHRVELWVRPAPPEGSVAVFVVWPGMALPETRVEVPASAFAGARTRIRDAWPGVT